MDNTATSINPDEIAKFQAIADAWWDETGDFKPLHQINPIRLAYIREQVISHFDLETKSLTPFDNLSVLDIGCGGGLLCEPMRKLGAQVTGLDAGEKNIKTASLHAEQQGLDITYLHSSVEELAGMQLPKDAKRGDRASITSSSSKTESNLTFAPKEQFDIILNMEVVEHVADVESFMLASAALLKPGGIMFVSTLNRTLKSYALAIVGAEYVLHWLPRGTHDWKKFLKPSEVEQLMSQANLRLDNMKGLTFNPINQSWRLGNDVGVNFLMCYKHGSTT